MKTIVAIVSILVLDAIALWQGLDGKFFILSVLAIAGLGGYPLVKFLNHK